MGYLGCVLFAAAFLFIGPTSRAKITASLSSSGEWIQAWAPFSYIILAMLLFSPIIAVVVLKLSPKIEEPENPLAKYKNEILPDDEG